MEEGGRRRNKVEYTIKLTDQQLTVILNALGERPLKEVLDTFSAVQQQAVTQAPAEKEDT